jgi:hypothetical protein
MSLSNQDFYPDYIIDAVKLAAGDVDKAVVNVVSELVRHGHCFSSGEVVRILRIVDPTLRFSMARVGSSVRAAFYNGELPPYDSDDGGQVFPLQVPRTCEGLYPDRTPAGQMVFVYGNSDEACEDHTFEVFIPVPNQDLSDVDNRDKTPAPAQPVQDKGPLTDDKDASVVSLKGKEIKATITAKVTAESRLYVPRKAFEHHAFLRGKGMRGGDAVYIQAGGDEVVISMAAFNGATEFTLEATRGRVKVPNSTGAPFSPGVSYEIVITADDIRIDLN